MRSDVSFDLFWQKVLKFAESYDIEPTLPQKCKQPRRYEDDDAESEFHDDPKAYFRQLYFKANDLSVNCITDRFQQPVTLYIAIWNNYYLKQLMEMILLGSSIQFVNCIKMM